MPPFSSPLISRYQRTSPDVLPLSNGRKPSLKVCKEDDPDSSRRTPANYSPLEAKPLRVRAGSGSGSATHSPARDPQFHHISFPSDSPTPSPATAHNENLSLPPSAHSSAAASPPKSGNHSDANGAIPGGGGRGDLLLQWGHNKRSRRSSRTESRAAAAAISTAAGGGDEPAAHSRQTGKIQRRSAIAAAEKVAAVVAASAAMPPPCGSYGRGGNIRPCTPLRDATSPAIHNGRGADERSIGVTRSEKRSPSSPPEKAQKTSAGSTPNGSMNPESKQQHHHHHPSDQETGGSGATAVASAGEKPLGLDHFEWPRIYISLSRKEKEDDFLVMKGTKLPQRPKKRAKNVDKTLQYCFPGMWLSDLTRGRYEVREKKCVKKKRRGLKGMEGMDSDSE